MTENELLNCEHITPVIAGAYLKVDAQTIRYWLQDKAVNFGIAHKREGSSRWAYYIAPEKLIKFKKEGGVSE